MSQNKEVYNAQSIKILKGLEAVKKRPGMYIGNVDDGTGLHHLVYEIVDNSIDEALAGYCNIINLTINQDKSITITDNGRGIPIDIHEGEGITAAELIMTQLHSGGKFDDISYKISGGLHGVGISVVNALSEKLLVSIWRNNKKYCMSFANGLKKIALTYMINKSNNDIGTQIHFLPSDKIFAHINFDFNILEHRLRELAFLNPEISINLIDNRCEENKIAKLHFDGGIINFIKYLNRAKGAINNIIRINGKQEHIDIDIAFQWNNSYHENILLFTNNIRQKDGGTHLTGFRGALTRVINNYTEINQVIKNHKIKICSDDIREGMTSVISIRFSNPKFSSQTKDKLISSEVRSIIESFVLKNLNKWFEMNPKESKLIIQKMIESALAREAARKAKDLTRQHNVNAIATLPGKIANCREKDPVKSELFVVEGDSAGGSAKQGRNRMYQAILPLKGKILNVERARFDKMLHSVEIGTLVTALKVSLEGKEFNLTNLRYHKIILMTDADVDGAHIRTLILTFFFRYMPSLIKKGYLYIAQPPLYRVKRSNSHQYLKNEYELKNFLKNIIANNIKIGDKIDSRIISIISNVFVFNDIINRYSQYLPNYILESLLLNGFFHYNKIDKNKLIVYLNKQFIKSKIDWKFELKNNILKIGMLESTIYKSYIINSDLIFNRCKEELLKNTYNLTDFLYKESLFYKGEELKYLNLNNLIKKLSKKAKKGLYIQRFKGLGEMNPDQLWETTLNPKNRVLLKVDINDFSEAERFFSILMGDLVAPRREFIKENALRVKNIDF